MKLSFRRWLPVAAGVLLSTASHAPACAVCMSGADENTGPALNGAIFFMLGCLAAIFTGIAGVAYAIWRRRNHQPPIDFATGEV